MSICMYDKCILKSVCLCVCVCACMYMHVCMQTHRHRCIPTTAHKWESGDNFGCQLLLSVLFKARVFFFQLLCPADKLDCKLPRDDGYSCL